MVGFGGGVRLAPWFHCLFALFFTSKYKYLINCIKIMAKLKKIESFFSFFSECIKYNKYNNQLQKRKYVSNRRYDFEQFS